MVIEQKTLFTGNNGISNRRKIYILAYDTRIRRKCTSSGCSKKAMCGGGIYQDADNRWYDEITCPFDIHGITL